MPYRELIESLNSTCSLNLQRKVNTFIKQNLDCNNVFIINVLNNAKEGVIQVIGDTVLDEEFRFSVTNWNPKADNENDIGDLDIKLRKILHPYPNNVLKIPITHPEEEGNICFIVCISDPVHKFNKETHSSVFVQDCLSTCSAILLNAFKFREEKHMKDLYHNLLDIAKESLLTISDHNELLKKIVIEARIAVNAEQCSLFLLSEDKSKLIGQIFDGVRYNQARGFKVPLNSGIIGSVAVKGEIVNVPDVQSHQMFYKGAIKSDDFKPRNVLCFPVMNELNEVIGVVEMCNKKNGQDFTHFDEQLSAAFGVYISIALTQGVAYRKIQTVKACNNLSAEIVTYHLMKEQEDLQMIFSREGKQEFENMLDYKWFCRQVDWSDMIRYLLNMFEQLGFTKALKIPQKTLISFFLSARVGYRDLPYHNWAHAFSVAHFSFLLMFRLNLIHRCLITKIEGAAFLVSALCHDLDHRGTTNSFQILSQNSLALLYSAEGSILERHHFSQTLSILNTDNCNIFENLSVPQYARVVSLIRDMIIATDMNQHLQVLPEERKYISLEAYNPGIKYHRFLLLSLMMTCCDLNDQVKGWIYCRDIAEKISLEFFDQGDMEKEMGRTPLDMMDRNRAFIPKIQLHFLTDICVPCFSVLSNLFPELEILVESINDTAYRWQKAIEWFKENNIPENLSISFIFNPDLVHHVLEK